MILPNRLDWIPGRGLSPTLLCGGSEEDTAVELLDAKVHPTKRGALGELERPRGWKTSQVVFSRARRSLDVPPPANW